MRYRNSLVVGAVTFGLLLARIGATGAPPDDERLLQIVAAIGIAGGVLATAAAVATRMNVASVHAALVAPAIVLIAGGVFVRSSAPDSGAAHLVEQLESGFRSLLEGTAISAGEVFAFGAAFWIIAAFWIDATTMGRPLLGMTPVIVATLAVTLFRSDATTWHIAADVALVAAALAATESDERRYQRGTTLVIAAERPPSRVRNGYRRLGFAAFAVAAALLASSALGSSVVRDEIALPDVFGGDQITYDPYVQIHQNLVDPEPVTLFTAVIAGDAGDDTYFSFTRLTAFDGTGFGPGPGTEPTVPARVDPIDQEITIGRLGNWAPFVTGALTVDDDELTAERGAVVGSVPRGTTYRVVSTGPVLPGDPVTTPVSPHPITESTAGISPAIFDLSRQVAGTGSGLDRARRLEEWFWTFDYEVPAVRVAAGVEEWLLDEEAAVYRRGYCEQFSLGMAVMARAAGLPSRVVIGTTPGRLENGVVTVTAPSAHAWVEVWLEDSGWTRFDPTPRRDGATIPSAPLAAAVLAEPASEPTPATASEFIDPFPADEAGSERTSPSAIPLAVIGIAALLLAFALLAVRRRKRNRALAGNIEEAWMLIVHRLESMGRSPQPTLTPTELAVRTDPAMMPLAAAYSRASYGASPPTAIETRGAVESMRLTEARLSDGRGRLDRVITASGVRRLRRRR